MLQTMDAKFILYPLAHSGRIFILGLPQGLNGAKIRNVWDVFCLEEAIELSPGFQPWEPTISERRALKGRQIERTNKVEVGPIVARRCARFFL
jgi:hypothetical protein